MILPLLLALAAPSGQAPQDPVDVPGAQIPVGREAVEAIQFPALEFEPPEIEEHEIFGVPVLYLFDPILPLVDLQIHVRGGVSYFPREDLAPLTALPILLRTGGTSSLAPDSVDQALDLLGAQLAMGSSGGGTQVALNVISDRTEPAWELLRAVLLEPGFSGEALEVWRGQEIERIRRREDNPSSLAFSTFNRLMYPDHPVGWVLEEDDLDPSALPMERIRALHRQLLCRERIVVGVSGGLTWTEASRLLTEFLAPWEPCESELPPPPPAEVRREPGVFLLSRTIDQSTVIVAQASEIRLGDSPDYFGSRIADFVLGGGGFGSRLVSAVRTEEGLAYGASSTWTAPILYDGLLGALTATSPETTIEATTLLLDLLRDFLEEPPSDPEVRDAAEKIASGYVFAFDSPARIIARRLAYRMQGLPDDWLGRYLEGIGEATPEQVRSTVRAHLDPDDLTILIVGDPERFGPGIEALGPVFELSPDGSYRPRVNSDASPDGSPRSRP